MTALPPRLLPLVALALLMASLVATTPPAHAATTTAWVRFGMDAASVQAQAAAGVKPDYGVLWIGPWTVSSGWGGPDDMMARLRAAGVTPAIHFYYWGDDITPSCVETGCWSPAQKVWKDRAHWEALADQLTSHVRMKMQGAPTVIFLESEFNKQGIGTYEPFDGYLAGMASRLHASYAGSVVVLGFGNWRSNEWGTFDRAAAASDYVGLQAMRGSTKDSSTAYNALYDSLLAGVRREASLFHKPLMVTDLALSSYAEPGYLGMQRDNLQKVFTGLQALRDAGVKALLYRSWGDAPGMSTANYYGEAERHFGLLHSDGSQKPAAAVWVNGVKAARSGTAGAGTSTTAAGTAFAATFTPKAVGNDWWVESAVSANQAVARVEARLAGGAWTALPKDGWGTYAARLHTPDGTAVQFRATSAATGAVAYSAVYTWT